MNITELEGKVVWIKAQSHHIRRDTLFISCQEFSEVFLDKILLTGIIIKTYCESPLYYFLKWTEIEEISESH